MPTLYPYWNARAGREGVSANALLYLLLGVVVLGGFAYWAHVSTTPKPRVFGVTPSVEVYRTATPDISLLPAIVFGPSPTSEREIRPYGYIGGGVIGPVHTPTPVQGDRLAATVTQVSPTGTPLPQPTRQSIEPFKVYVFQQPEMVNQFVVEYPYLVLTHQALPPGVSVLETSRSGDEAFPTRQALRYGDAYLPPHTPTPLPSPTWTDYQANLMATVQAWEAIAASTPAAPAAPERAVGGAERFSEAPPLAPRGRIQPTP